VATHGYKPRAAVAAKRVNACHHGTRLLADEGKKNDGHTPLQTLCPALPSAALRRSVAAQVAATCQNSGAACRSGLSEAQQSPRQQTLSSHASMRGRRCDTRSPNRLRIVAVQSIPRQPAGDTPPDRREGLPNRRQAMGRTWRLLGVTRGIVSPKSVTSTGAAALGDVLRQVVSRKSVDEPASAAGATSAFPRAILNGDSREPEAEHAV
jgi:hypothetical protein